MSAAAARARRAQRRATEEVIAQAHDRLHKDDVEAAHELIHLALGLDNNAEVGEPFRHRAGFDHAFIDLCRRHNVRAVYLLADAVDGTGRIRLLSGGDAELCARVDDHFRSRGAHT